MRRSHEHDDHTAAGTPSAAPARRTPDAIWQAVGDRFKRGELGSWPSLVGLAVIWLFFQSQDAQFLSARNLSNLVLQIGVLSTLAIGVVLVLFSGEIDLSLGAVTGVSSAVLGVLLTNDHWSSGAAILVTLLTGVLIGLLQGGIVVLIGVPSFIVTLAGFLAWGGVQTILLGEIGELLIQDTTVRSIASAYLTSVQSWVIAAIFVIGCGWVLWRRRMRRQRTGLEVSSRALLWAATCVGGTGGSPLDRPPRCLLWRALHARAPAGTGCSADLAYEANYLRPAYLCDWRQYGGRTARGHSCRRS